MSDQRVACDCAHHSPSLLTVGLFGLSASFSRMSDPTNQTNQIDEIDQINQSPFDARSGRPIGPPFIGKYELAWWEHPVNGSSATASLHRRWHFKIPGIDTYCQRIVACEAFLAGAIEGARSW